MKKTQTIQVQTPIHYYDYLAFGDTNGMTHELIQEINEFKQLHNISKLIRLKDMTECGCYIFIYSVNS